MNVPVDKGIAALVAALSAFPKLQTLESCQGDGRKSALIVFRYGDYWTHPWREAAEFVLGSLGPYLQQELGDRAYLSLSVTGSGVQAALEVRPGALRRTVQAIKKFSAMTTP